MPKKNALAIDFKALKRTLAGSGPANPVNCGVVMLDDKSVSMNASRSKSPKWLAHQLLDASHEEGLKSRKCLFGTAYMDEFPGTIYLALNRNPADLAKKLKFALRGSGFGNVEITLTEDSEAEAA